MKTFTRGQFISLGAALAGGIGGRPAEAGAGERVSRSSPALTPERTANEGAAEMVVLNGRVLTQDEGQPQAEALAVRHGRFIAVGSDDEIRNLVSRGTEVIDAEGMTVTPGFIDAHTHPRGISELLDVNCNLGSIANIMEAMRKKALETPPGHWVRGFMYDDTKLAEGRPLSRMDLDEVVPDRPAVVGHRGGHTGVYNSAAFELAGVAADTPDPQGGKFYRENGELTGKVAERARGVFRDLGKSIEISRETRQAGVAAISKEMTATGLTSVHQTGGDTDNLIALQDAHAADEMRFRMYLFPSGNSELFSSLLNAGVRTGFGDDWLKIGAVKYGADGSASERTMYMSTPYKGRPDDYGILTMTQEEIHEAVEQAHRHDFQIGIHANGDLTIDMVLKAYERVQELWPRPDPRHRIEHCSLVNPELLRRIKSVGAIPTPFYTYIHYHGEKWIEYGEEKMRWMFAHRSFLDHGIPVAPASDYTPGPYEPMMAIQSMVTRKDFQGRVWGPNQRISVSEALKICTVHGAYAAFEEHSKGSITAGKLADFVLLARDPHDAEPDRIKEIEIVRTVVGGRSVHTA